MWPTSPMQGSDAPTLHPAAEPGRSDTNPGTPQAYAVWMAALETLEANLVRSHDWMTCLEYCDCTAPDDVEDLAVDDSAWRVPADMPGPIPVALVPRAQSIAIRQSRVRTSLLAKLAERNAQPHVVQSREALETETAR